jgi:hypothetical protein
VQEMAGFFEQEEAGSFAFAYNDGNRILPFHC